MAPLPAVTARRAGALLALALLLAAGPPLVRSQGLIYDPQAVLAASAVQTSLNTLYAASKAWRRSYSKAAHIACRCGQAGTPHHRAGCEALACHRPFLKGAI